MGFDRILVPIDFSEHSRRALDHATELAVKLGGRIELLHVWEPPTYVPSEVGLSMAGFASLSLADYGRAEATRDMEQLVAATQARSPQVRGRVELGSTAATILRVAEEVGADLIVIGTHGRGAFERLILGGVAHKIVSRAPCPVLTVGPARSEKR